MQVMQDAIASTEDQCRLYKGLRVHVTTPLGLKAIMIVQDAEKLLLAFEAALNRRDLACGRASHDAGRVCQ